MGEDLDEQPAATVEPGWTRKSLAIMGALLAITGGLLAVAIRVQHNNPPEPRLVSASEAAETLARSSGLSLQRDVEYCVRGTATSLDLTLTNAGGNTEQVEGKANNQCLNLGRMRRGSHLYIAAQNSSTASGTVECQIKVNGRVVERAKSEGRYVIATCSGRL